MNDAKIGYPKIVSRNEWLAAHHEQLEKEKTHTWARDALNAERSRMPMWQVDKYYEFEGPNGRVSTGTAKCSA